MSLNSTPHTLHKLDQRLAEIRAAVLEMGRLALDLAGEAVAALEEGDAERARRVIEREARVDELEGVIDRECMETIALHQPKAGDLRFLIGTIKTINDLERIGDGACAVAHTAVALSEAGEVVRRLDLSGIAMLWGGNRQMLEEALQAYETLDEGLVVKVAERDRNVEREYEQVLRRLMSVMMAEPETITEGSRLMSAARVLVRVGDHAGNVCEHVVFIARGKDVHHVGLEQLRREIGQG